jgi:hypothetical protein
MSGRSLSARSREREPLTASTPRPMMNRREGGTWKGKRKKVKGKSVVSRRSGMVRDQVKRQKVSKHVPFAAGEHLTFAFLLLPFYF